MSIREDREFCFCEYCGTKIMCVNENAFNHTHNHTYTHTRVDEAEIIRAETERMIAIDRLQREAEQRRTQKKKKAFGCLGSTLVFLIKTVIVFVLVFLVFIGVMALLEGPEELGWAGLIGAGGLYFMWDHRGKKKER